MFAFKGFHYSDAPIAQVLPNVPKIPLSLLCGTDITGRSRSTTGGPTMLLITDECCFPMIVQQCFKGRSQSKGETQNPI